jgi:hypothetical protein
MRNVIIISLVALLAPMSALAQEDAPAPETDESAEARALTVEVVSVEGTVQYRDGSVEDSEWLDLEAGMELNEWAIILTGFRSQAVLNFPTQGEILVRGSTMIGISEFRQEGGEYQTHVGMRYGSVRATVDPDRPAGAVAVATPVATAAPRGSWGDIGFSDFGAAFNCLHGFFLWYTQNGNTGLQGGQQGNGNNMLSALLAALQNDPVLGDLFGGMTEEELLWLIQNGQGIFGFGNFGFGALFDFFSNHHYSPEFVTDNR